MVHGAAQGRKCERRLSGGLIAGPAVATDQDTFNKLIAKVAPLLTFMPGQKFKPTVACACPNTGSGASPGFVVNNGASQIVCGIPTFDASGTLNGYSDCSDFAVLGH